MAECSSSQQPTVVQSEKQSCMADDVRFITNVHNLFIFLYQCLKEK